MLLINLNEQCRHNSKLDEFCSKHNDYCLFVGLIKGLKEIVASKFLDSCDQNSCDQNDLQDPYIIGIYNKDLASDIFLGKR